MREAISLHDLVPVVPSQPSRQVARLLVWLLIGLVAVIVALPTLAVSLIVATLIMVVRPFRSLFRAN